MLNNTSKHTNSDNNGYNGHGMEVPETPQAMAEHLAKLEAQIEDLKKQVKLARGTETIEEAPPSRRLDLAERIEQALRSNIFTTDELARYLGEPAAKVSEKIRTIRKNLADVGTPEQARWVWRIGDEASAKELKAMVARLIEGHAMTTAELTRITGARMSRVNGVLVELQRAVNEEGKPMVPIYNLGSNFRAQWLILPKTAKPANLPPKTPRK